MCVRWQRRALAARRRALGARAGGISSFGAWYCWGNNGDGRTNTPATGRLAGAGDAVAVFTDTAVTLYCSCALTADGDLMIIGDSFPGVTTRFIAGPFTAIRGSGTQRTVCALHADGRLRCFSGSQEIYAAAPPVFSPVDWVMHEYGACGVATGSSALVCWGAPQFASAPAVAPADNYTLVAAGGTFTCAARGLPVGGVRCWGENVYLQVSGVPPGVAGAEISALCAGFSYAAALTATGQLYVWGSAGTGCMPCSRQFTSVTCGSEHYCAIGANGLTECLGSNNYGRMDVPTSQSDLFTSVGAGYFWTCAVRPDGDLQAFGQVNAAGSYSAPAPGPFLTCVGTYGAACALRLGSGVVHCFGVNKNDVITNAPKAAGFVSLAGSMTRARMCAVHSNGSAVCWGDNTSGAAALPPGTSPVAGISTGAGHTCVVRRNGSLACFGTDTSWQLGVRAAVVAAPCAAGSAGPPACRQCLAGQYAGPGAIACASCMPGSYAASAGAGRCTRCPAGTAGAAAGSAVSAGCVACAPGTAAPPGSSACAACGANTYAASAGSAYCRLCAPGTATGAAVGASACSACDPGTCGAASVRALVSGGRDLMCAAGAAGTGFRCWGAMETARAVPPSAALAKAAAVVPGWDHTIVVAADGAAACYYGNANDCDKFAEAVGGTPLTAVAMGQNCGCAISAVGELLCFGSNGDCFESVRLRVGPYTAVATTGGFVCALRASGVLECFGYNGNGQLNVPKSLVATSVAVGSAGFTCVIARSGAIRCWGSGSQDAPPPGKFVHIAAQVSLACAVPVGGRNVSCWGSDAARAWGREPPAPGDAYVQVGLTSGSYQVACAVTALGAVRCWGDVIYGGAPPAAPATGAVITAAAGDGYTCVLSAGYTVSCAGVADTMNAGSGPDPALVTPPRFTAIAAGGPTACGLQNGTNYVVCWPPSRWGLKPLGSGSFGALSVSMSHGCAVQFGPSDGQYHYDGRVSCWGNGPSPSGLPLDFVAVCAGYYHSCGLNTNASVNCWGGDDQYGRVSYVWRSRYTAVACGGYSTCAVKVSGTLECSGNVDNRIAGAPTGTGITAVCLSPQESPLSGHGCAVQGGSIVCWCVIAAARALPRRCVVVAVSHARSHRRGLNDFGQASPSVSPNTGFVSVTCGVDRTCGTRTDGTFECFGGRPGSTAAPVAFAGLRPCGPGAAAPLDAFSNCSACAAGTLAARAGAFACDTCPPGYGPTASGAASCSPCAAGSASRGAGGACATCAAGAVSVPGSPICVDVCPVGTFVSGDTCMPCAAGTYGVGGNVCRPCPPGTANPEAGMFGIDNACAQCGPGTRSAGGAASCQLCASGTWASASRTFDCTPCPAGTSNDAVGARTNGCATCAQGKYAAAGDPTCNDCPAGTHGSGTGATSVSACENCAAGSWSPRGYAEASCTSCSGTDRRGAPPDACDQCNGLCCPDGADVNCAGCSRDTGRCTSCAKHYYLTQRLVNATDVGGCALCNATNCATCDADPFVCMDCDAGYSLQEGACWEIKGAGGSCAHNFECVSFVTLYNNYLLVPSCLGGVCCDATADRVLCTDCAGGGGSGVCSKCDAGFAPVPSTGGCAPCKDAACALCPIDENLCTECKSGFVISDGWCSLPVDIATESVSAGQAVVVWTIPSSFSSVRIGSVMDKVCVFYGLNELFCRDRGYAVYPSSAAVSSVISHLLSGKPYRVVATAYEVLATGATGIHLHGILEFTTLQNFSTPSMPGWLLNSVQAVSGGQVSFTARPPLVRPRPCVVLCHDLLRRTRAGSTRALSTTRSQQCLLARQLLLRSPTSLASLTHAQDGSSYLGASPILMRSTVALRQGPRRTAITSMAFCLACPRTRPILFMGGYVGRWCALALFLACAVLTWACRFQLEMSSLTSQAQCRLSTRLDMRCHQRIGAGC